MPNELPYGYSITLGLAIAALIMLTLWYYMSKQKNKKLDDPTENYHDYPKNK